MTKEHRDLIRQECDRIVEEHDRLAAEAKANGDAVTSCCHTYTSKGALELMLAILHLNQDDKI